jgi:hypothetical protein
MHPLVNIGHLFVQPLISVDAKLTATEGTNIYFTGVMETRVKPNIAVTAGNTGKNVRRRMHFIVLKKKISVVYPNRVMKHK